MSFRYYVHFYDDTANITKLFCTKETVTISFYKFFFKNPTSYYLLYNRTILKVVRLYILAGNVVYATNHLQVLIYLGMHVFHINSIAICNNTLLQALRKSSDLLTV